MLLSAGTSAHGHEPTCEGRRGLSGPLSRQTQGFRHGGPERRSREEKRGRTVPKRGEKYLLMSNEEARMAPPGSRHHPHAKRQVAKVPGPQVLAFLP